MKYTHLLLLLLIGYKAGAQNGDILQIIPANPGNQDSIKIVSKLDYNGGCSYGLVSFYTYQLADTFVLVPTYCGFGLSTPCTSIDTFQIGPLPTGLRSVRIEYHQGSVCPLSGFDARIAQKDTVIQVNATVGMPENRGGDFFDAIQQGHDIHIKTKGDWEHGDQQLELLDSTGRVLKRIAFKGDCTFKVPGLPSGVYFLLLTDASKQCHQAKRIYLQ